MFALFTYIQPLLTQISGFSAAAVSPILLVFGAGFIGGNLLGGKLADKHLVRTLLGTLLALAAVLGAMTFALHTPWAAILFTACWARPASPPWRLCKCGCCSRPRARGRTWPPA